jgi:ribosome-binding protein aMBF1 (putative translation factor)
MNPIEFSMQEHAPAGRERGLSQEALAHECGMGRTYLSSVERSERNVSIDNIARITQEAGSRRRSCIQDRLKEL